MPNDFNKAIEKILEQIEEITLQYCKLREAYKREPDNMERQKLTQAVNRLNEKVLGLKLSEQADKVIPLFPKKTDS